MRLFYLTLLKFSELIEYLSGLTEYNLQIC